MNPLQEQFENYVSDIIHVNYTDWDSIFVLKNAIDQFRYFLEESIENIPPTTNAKEWEIDLLLDDVTKLENFKKDKRSDLSKMLDVKSDLLNRIRIIRRNLEKEGVIRYKPVQK